ncbi:hypothetical protein [Agaribacter flavus]|uniref:Uncharacterized protein n=1 Tax=Agaribacter flavus TaxID=1902781 RepID=A0ABV7FQG5_9ALTE
MIDPTKLNSQLLQNKTVKRKNTQVNKIEKGAELPKTRQPNSTLVETILASIETNEGMGDDAKRREYIVKTLQSILGEKASGSPVFKQLISSIELALKSKR